ncbi:hypothetical protein VPH35_052767 [Triticum aestivum]
MGMAFLPPSCCGLVPDPVTVLVTRQKLAAPASRPSSPVRNILSIQSQAASVQLQSPPTTTRAITASTRQRTKKNQHLLGFPASNSACGPVTGSQVIQIVLPPLGLPGRRWIG